MKRTSKFCAILFCAMLWLNPAGAQQRTRIAAEKQAGESMDKISVAAENPVMQRNMTVAADMLPLLKRSDVKLASELKLSDQQKKEMVRAYMRQAIGSPAKAGGDDAKHVFVGGSPSNEYMFKATYVDQEMTDLSQCKFPYTSSGKTLYPFWGTWNGHYYEGLWAIKSANGGSSVVGYFTYDPLTDEADQLTTAYLSGDQGGIFSDACAYDYSSDKVYTLLNEYTSDYDAITGITFYSADKGTAVFEEAFSIEISTPNIPVSMAIDKTGKFYIFCTDGKVYTVKQKGETYSLEGIGDTKQPTDLYSQSAAWDYRSDKVYWANVSEDGYGYMSIWDPSDNNTSTRLGSFRQTMGLASVYYVDNNPMPVEPFGLSYDANAQKVVATFVVPDVTINGDPITELKAVHIYSVTSAGQLGQEVVTINNPVPGQKCQENITAPGTEGAFTYAICVENTNNVLSDFSTAEVRLINVTLPYINGFEDNESDKMANVTITDPLNKGGLERTNEEAHTGTYSYKMTSNFDSDGRLLNFEALPVKKAGVYSVSFWAKSSVAQRIYVWYNDELQGYLAVGTDWEEMTLRSYTADVKGQFKFSLCALSTDPIYIDDVEIKEALTPDFPGMLTINSVTAGANNTLRAVMNITLPSLAASDEPLASIDGVVVHYAEDANFTTYKTDTLKTGLTVGATADFTVQIEKAGQYYFRAYAYNEYGRCPQYSTYANLSPWIGPKNMPVSIATATINKDGDVEVAWIDPSLTTEISWTKNGIMGRRLTIDGESAFKYAQSFDAADLATYGMATPKALQIGFVPGSETADYTLVLAYGGTENDVIYRKPIDKTDLQENEWYYTTVDEDITIDITRPLWVIVEVAASKDQGYACAATTTTVREGKSNRICYNGTWSTITQLFTNGAGSVLVSLKVEDPATAMAPDNGYKVYRGKVESKFEDYELLASSPADTKTYTDQAWKGLAFGQYHYAVVAVWGETDATPAMTNVLNKDMEMTVTFVITSNTGSAEGAEVAMLGATEEKLYTAVADAEGKVVFQKVWRDEYMFEVVLPFHRYYFVEKFNLTKDTLVEVELTEIIVDPELTASVEGRDVAVSYGVNLHNWFDDVESYTDFAIANIGNYILSEPVQKGGIQNVTWTNSTVPQSWIVFNPDKTQPAMNMPAHSGNKVFASFYSDQNNDYLIRPVSRGGGDFVFYCRAYSASYPEAFNVVYSSTTADLSAFKTVQSYPRVSATSWSLVNVSIPEDAKYIGIQCTSADAFAFMVDDLAYYVEESANPTGYALYLDGEKLAEVNELTYTFRDLTVGEHKVGVKALYASGESRLVEETVTIVAEAKPINLHATTEENMAILTWDMPEGFTPKAYKVYLGEELKADNLTEKTYTFTDLEDGEYTAAVVAVYEASESEKATVSFKIQTVGVEEASLMAQTHVYPNPNNGIFYLRTEVAGVAEVYTLTGQKLQQTMVPGAGIYVFNMNRVCGMYIVKFVSGKETRLFKVVVR